jgi:hypothetical protein
MHGMPTSAQSFPAIELQPLCFVTGLNLVVVMLRKLISGRRCACLFLDFSILRCKSVFEAI